MPKLLTVRKQRWVNQFKPDALRGVPLNPNAATEMRYYKKLSDLINKMTSEVEQELKKFFKEPHSEAFFAEDIDISSQARILTNALMRSFQKLFDLRSKDYAEGMMRDVDGDSSKALHASLKDLSGGLSLQTTVISGELESVMNATITENVNLIRSISRKYLGGVQQAVMRSITTGRGLQDLVPYLQNERGVTLRRARIIAEDQTRKAFSNMNRIRMEKVGIQEFEWLHSAGSLRPRKLHINYNGRTFRIDEPPIIEEKTGERGFPGQAINCKCRMRPVIRFKGEDHAIGARKK